MQDEVTVTQVDEAKALEVFNDALGDMGSFAEYGRPSYQDGALRTIAVHLARHRQSAERGEVVAWMYKCDVLGRTLLTEDRLEEKYRGAYETETPLYTLPAAPEATAFTATVGIRRQTKTIESVDELLRLINGGALLTDVRRAPEAA